MYLCHKSPGSSTIISHANSTNTCSSLIITTINIIIYFSFQQAAVQAPVKLFFFLPVTPPPTFFSETFLRNPRMPGNITAHAEI